jgi:hypothetical protein
LDTSGAGDEEEVVLLELGQDGRVLAVYEAADTAVALVDPTQFLSVAALLGSPLLRQGRLFRRGWSRGGRRSG